MVTDKDIEKLVHMNQRLNLMLGYSMGLIMKFRPELKEDDLKRYKWLVKAIENVVYLDKPLPEIP